uniref:DNA-(apurinic or apyrimidinic site) endonuclease n=1 Tax=Arion vulgaris TaxID=1028688 RepID=A0A0B7AGN5_9EUPU
MPLTILTWNVNGIRAMKVKSTKQLLDSLQADIICLQETKVTRDMLDEPTAIVEGYDSYFSFSRKRTGYSGTVNYCNMRACPLKAEEGLTGRHSSSYEDIIKCYGDTDKYASDLDALDAEGRCVITLHQIRLPDVGLKDVAIINVYVPRAGDKEDRLQYKLKFLTLLQSRAEALREQKIHVIILGDMNLTHRKMDNCDSECDDDFKLRSSRTWMNEFLQKSERDASIITKDQTLTRITLPNLKGGMFSDVYRQLHSDQENAFTNWNTSTDARKTNYGKRLDYILIDTELSHYVSSCEIMTQVQGSDHCPVVVTLNCDPVSSKTCPQLCSKYMPEFKGQQQKLSSFFSKSVKQEKDFYHSSIVLSCSPDHLQDVTRFPVTKSTPDSANISRSQPLLKKNTIENVRLASKHPEKKNVTAAVKQKNVKRMKTDTNQISLKLFFTSVDSTNNTGVDTRTVDITKSTDDIWISDTEVNSHVPPVHSSCTLSSGDAGLCMHISENSLGLSELQEIGQSHCSCSSVTNVSKSKSSGSDNNSADNSVTGASPSSSHTSMDTSPVVKDTSQAWKSLLTGPPPPPLCPGHNEPCVLKTVNKKGPNKNKKFYVCARPEGATGNPAYRCNFFLWYNHNKSNA